MSAPRDLFLTGKSESTSLFCRAANVVVAYLQKKPPMPAKKRLLILCTGNSAAPNGEGLLRHDAGDRLEVESAGTKPTNVRPGAIAVMKELGIDISGHRPKSVDELKAYWLPAF
jgi:hypothetical protein